MRATGREQISTSSPAYPYAGRTAVLATRHGKERALALPLSRLGLALATVPELDTDSLGTFSGEIRRTRSPLDTAISKARMGMIASGLPLGIANEGSFGPHPANPFVQADHELLVLVDDERSMVVQESLLTHRTCHSQCRASDPDMLQPWLRQVGFPRQALIVRPASATANTPMFKGVADGETLAHALEMSARVSEDGAALIEPDLRAHHSPLRMRAIRRLGWRMLERLRCLCPACNAPGYGWLETTRGLPCSWCASPTRLALAEVHGCSRCDAREQRPPHHGLHEAEPGHCEYCNP